MPALPGIVSKVHDDHASTEPTPISESAYKRVAESRFRKQMNSEYLLFAMFVVAGSLLGYIVGLLFVDDKLARSDRLGAALGGAFVGTLGGRLLTMAYGVGEDQALIWIIPIMAATIASVCGSGNSEHEFPDILTMSVEPASVLVGSSSPRCLVRIEGPSS